MSDIQILEAQIERMAGMIAALTTRAEAAEANLAGIGELMAGWTWHEGRIEGRAAPTGRGSFVNAAIRLASFRRLRGLIFGAEGCAPNGPIDGQIEPRRPPSAGSGDLAVRTEAWKVRVVALEAGIRDVLRIVRTEPHNSTDEVIERRLAGLFPSKGT